MAKLIIFFVFAFLQVARQEELQAVEKQDELLTQNNVENDKGKDEWTEEDEKWVQGLQDLLKDSEESDEDDVFLQAIKNVLNYESKGRTTSEEKFVKDIIEKWYNNVQKWWEGDDEDDKDWNYSDWSGDESDYSDEDEDLDDYDDSPLERRSPKVMNSFKRFTSV